MKDKNIFGSLCFLLFLSLYFHTYALADVYQRTDSDGSVHFSDNPMSIPRGKRPVVRQEESNSSQNTRTQSAPTKKMVKETNIQKVAQEKTETGKKDPSYDPGIEAQLRSIYLSHQRALARGDARAAAEMIVSYHRADCMEGFIALGTRLKELSDDNEIELVYVSDDNAKCRVFRNEVVLGKNENVGYPVYFIKENGVWKLDKC